MFALLPYASALLAVVLACLHAARRRSISDAALAAGLVVLATDSVFLSFCQQVSAPQDVAEWAIRRLLVLAAMPGVWLLFSTTYARGSSGWRRRSQGNRASLVASIFGPVALALIAQPGLITTLQQTADGARLLTLGLTGVLLQVWILVGGVLVLMNLERTFRAAVGTMRWQVKFTTLAIGLLFVVRSYTSSQVLLTGQSELGLENANTMALLMAVPLLGVSFIRTRDKDPDVYPSQSLFGGSVTLLTAGTYLLIVGVFAKLIAYLGGNASFAFKTFVVLVLLVGTGVLLQSDHARLHVRRFLSRAFQRPLFDYRTVWRRFNESTTNRVETTDLCRSLVRLTAETFNALSVSIWLHDRRNDSLQLAASTVIAESRGPELAPDPDESASILSALSPSTGVFNVDLTRQPWAATLQRMHPKEFPHGGYRFAIPLTSGGEILGLLLMGDRVGGMSLAVQESDMLKCIADHAAANLRNLQLSQRLLEARELEAFQTMATFFVHDLKNAASTLNLMLQNLPIHFDDPEFRQDALRGIGKSVDHINRLISRLSSIRHEIKIAPAAVDLNALVGTAVGTLDPITQQMIHQDLQPIPKLPLDAEQILKVLTNLLLNAREASGTDGRIAVSTRHEGANVVLTVQDNGCGMSPEFIQRSLFRPFQTTKKAGLGIGMFQTKMIVQAHGGSIRASSKPNVGTTFQIHLPTDRSGPAAS